MHTSKRKFRIGELASLLNVTSSVLQLWTREFKLHPRRLPNGHRLYSTKDVEKFKLIKELVYTHKYTLTEVHDYFKQEASLVIPAQKITFTVPNIAPKKEILEHTEAQITILYKKLLKLRELL